MSELPTIALSIRQPWAAVIIGGCKDVENRTWQTKVRGPVLIHAGQAKIDEDDWDFVKEILAENKLRCGHPALTEAGEPWPMKDQLPKGGIVGMAEIVNCVTDMESPWFFGPFGLVLKNVKPLPFFKCKGALGFFRVSYPQELFARNKSREPGKSFTGLAGHPAEGSNDLSGAK